MSTPEAYSDFLLQHLQGQMQEEYGLEDEDLENLASFLEGFEGGNRSQALVKATKPANRDSLKKVMQEVLDREFQEDAETDMKFEPVTMQDTLNFPMGIPLSKEMDIFPSYEGGYTF
jgi:hypothetical protein